MTRVKLLFPPHFSIYQPYLSVPALTTFLKEKGVFVSQEDLNLSSFYYFTQPDYLQQCQNKIEHVIQKYEKKDILPNRSEKHYKLLCKTLLSTPLVIPNIEGAIEFFHSKDKFLDFDEYSLQERIILQALQIVSVAHYPTHVSLVDFLMNYSPESSKEIFDAIVDNGTNPYISYFKRYVVNKLAIDKPDLVGISLSAMSQVIPGLTLASVIKQNLPDVKIAIGGVIPNHLSQKMKAIPKLFTLFDYLIKGEGETPLYELCKSIAGKTSVDSVPNLIYSGNGSIHETHYKSIEDVNVLPTPDYDGFNLKKYLSPLPVLSIEPARGCYWRKCTFCNQYSIHGKTFRRRDPEFIICDIKKLQEKYGASLFNISNEGVPADHLSRISEAISGAGLNIQWYAGAQLKKSFSKKVCHLLRRAGCRKLIFGLESGSQRVLNLMNKGIILDKVLRILQNCTDAGLDVHFYLMIGFPTETFKEIEATQDFVLGALSNVNKEGFTFYISVFQPVIESPIICHVGKLGYEIKNRGEKFDLTYVFEQKPKSKHISQLSRRQLERISANMSSAIYSHLPAQAVPEELTHYLCYQLLGYEPVQNSVKECKSETSNWKSLLKSQRFVKKSKWASLRKIRFLPNSRSEDLGLNVMLYNISTDKYYLLNRAALHYFGSLSSPKTIGKWLREIGNISNLNESDDIRRCLIYLWKENLIETE